MAFVLMSECLKVLGYLPDLPFQQPACPVCGWVANSDPLWDTERQKWVTFVPTSCHALEPNASPAF
jgi:hypothetical protein